MPFNPKTGKFEYEGSMNKCKDCYWFKAQFDSTEVDDVTCGDCEEELVLVSVSESSANTARTKIMHSYAYGYKSVRGKDRCSKFKTKPIGPWVPLNKRNNDAKD